MEITGLKLPAGKTSWRYKVPSPGSLDEPPTPTPSKGQGLGVGGRDPGPLYVSEKRQPVRSWGQPPLPTLLPLEKGESADNKIFSVAGGLLFFKKPPSGSRSLPSCS